MAVMLACTKCRSTAKLGTKVCKKCKNSFANSRKYKLAIRLPSGKWRTKMVAKLDAARRLERKWTDEIRIHGDIESARDITLEQVWFQFDKRVNLRLKDPSAYDGQWRKHIGPKLGHKALRYITPSVLADFANHMHQKRVKASHNAKSGNMKFLSPRTIHISIGLVKRLFNYAMEYGLWEGGNPVRKSIIPSYDNTVTNVLNNNQISALVHALDKWPNRMAALAFKFLLVTGKRAGEVFGLRWDHVDLIGRTALFHVKSKHVGKVQRLPLSDLAREILLDAQQHRINGCPLIFHTCTGKRISYRPAWLRILKSAGIPSSFRVHDLRHTFATTTLRTRQVDLYSLRKILGHTSTKTTERYLHYCDEDTRKGLDAMSSIINDLT